MACIKEILPEPVSATPRKKRKTSKRPLNIALVGNPNAGKTALFNRLTGLRARTGNFPGTTVERHVGRFDIGKHSVEVVDLPGMYSMTPATPEEHVGHDMLFGKIPGVARPDGIVFIIDADNLERNLFLLSQVREFDFPVIVALNMIDVAARHGIQIDTERLSVELGCPVVSIIAKTGTGLDTLKLAIKSWIPPQTRTVIPLPVAAAIDDCACAGCCGCAFKQRFDYTEKIADRCSQHPAVASPRRTEAIDRILTNTFTGVPAFFGVMLAVFYLIFSAASIPMDMIDGLFVHIGGWITNTLPDGALRSLLVEGIIGGVGGILVFLPQICILFFFLGLLEDTGYLSRAAFVMDRLMRRVGLPGSAFIPLLSSHACAIPGIMATRVIRDERDRLVTILIAPLMTCSARLPVYAMVTALIFPDEPLKAALVFTGAYSLGIVAALTMAFVFKKTILPGESKPIILELPGYKVPCLRSVFLHTYDRAKIFVQQAGTMILLISVLLWAAATYPKPDNVPEEVVLLQQKVELATAAGNMAEAETLKTQAANMQHQFELEYSVAGRLGKFIEPVVRPLGFDWQIGIGVMTSFAAREVIVSTLSIVYGVGADAGEENPVGLYDTLRKATRADGSAVFTTATGLSLLVFYVLAMQCLPTQIVTKRETGSWKWAIFQLVYMTVLAYGASFATFQGLRLLGIS